MKYNFKALGTFIILVSTALFYQNCSDVKLAPVIPPEKLSCDPSIYNIAGQFTEGDAVYFIQANNYDITQEYSGTINWFIDGVLQDENIVHHNRLHLSCDSQPEAESIKAQFITDCGTEIEIFGSTEYLSTNICEEEEPDQEPVGDYCMEYLDSLSPIERAEFEAYKIENSSSEKVEMTFTEKTQRVLGSSTGAIQAALPGAIGNNAYLALSFTMPGPEPEDNTGKFRLKWGPSGTGGVVHRPTEVSISPCPGDFRPIVEGRTDPYMRYVCRGEPRMEGVVYGGTDSDRCFVPPNKKMYINIRTYAMDYDDCSQLPCGAIFQLGK